MNRSRDTGANGIPFRVRLPLYRRWAACVDTKRRVDRNRVATYSDHCASIDTSGRCLLNVIDKSVA